MGSKPINCVPLRIPMKGRKSSRTLTLPPFFFFNPNRAFGTTLYSDGGVGNFEDPLWRVRLWIQSPLIVCLCKFL